MTTQIGILVVGNEILDGMVLDTNSQWIINQLKALNLQVSEKMTVRDEAKVIARAIRRMISNGDNLIFTTGGLGPTHDDKTLMGVAMAFELPLELNDAALRIVTRQYADMHQRGIIGTSEITEPRRKMAILPRGARPLDNRVGGAPGVVLEIEGAQIISLPGVPGELMWIFDNQLLGLLKGKVEGAFAEDVIYLPLRDESTLAPIIDEVMQEVPGVYIKSMVKPYGESGIRLWISAGGQSQAEVEERVNRVANLLVKRCEEQLPNS
ncbi:MAG: competence/damage-inducible protein A [Candidatus Bathyarchaeota archaeon]|nr:MAG: competence/damage-inducible protein A [Candidatus Bathyarchaeota archaeon]